MQHLLDAAEVSKQSFLRSVANLLATESVSNVVTKFLAGGNLTALTKDKVTWFSTQWSMHGPGSGKGSIQLVDKATY